MARRQVGLQVELDDVDAWDAWAAKHGLSRTQAIEFAMAGLLTGRMLEERQAAPQATGAHHLRSYPSLPEDSTKGKTNARRQAVDERNARLQAVAIKAPPSGIFGKGDVPKD